MGLQSWEKRETKRYLSVFIFNIFGLQHLSLSLPRPPSLVHPDTAHAASDHNQITNHTLFCECDSFPQIQ
ncbi:hypothetical protein L1887_11436 [Cichorium endivia]|nr:hypothetical protein L1887_11436 [Cichorium endivia]